jgi:hypothetical protein
VACCLGALVATSVPGKAQSGNLAPSRGVEIQAELAEGLPIAMVYVHVVQPASSAEATDELKEQVAAAFGIREGQSYRQIVAAFGLNRVRRLASVQSAEMRLFNAVPSGRVAVALLVTPQPEAPVAPAETKDEPAAADARRFPTILEDERSRFVYILNGGIGVFSDSDPWFGGYGDAFNGGNPTAKDPLGPGTSAWIEGYVEPGLGGISQVSDSPFYLYGAVSWLMSGTAGHDIYNSGQWGHGDFEKLYAGMIWNLPGEKTLLDVSVGKQVYQLRDGFLLSKIPVSTSIGERAALYLGPRLSSENTVLVRAKSAKLGLDAFLIEPSEIEEIASDTKLAGVNLQYAFEGVEAAFTYFYVPDSNSTFRAPGSVQLPREGLRTYNPSRSLKKLFGREGIWLKAEYAYQDHEDFDMSADAGFVWAGYEMTKAAWRPTFSYRWSYFSGDDPDTSTYERFDPLFSGGLGNFLPGIVFSKTYKNANLITHRATVSLKPRDQLELIVDYFNHRADVKNNLGGIGPLQTLQSTDIGDEITFTAYKYIGKNLFFQGIASVGRPGKAFERALGSDTTNWYTAQAALYWFF